MTEKVHAHGALAGAELWYGGARNINLYSRLPPMDLDNLPNMAGMPYQTKAMDKTDIRNIRRWHKKAALRAKEAEFDIVYVYATHDYLLSHFLDPRSNTRTDEYGGSLENRVRLVRELIEETKEAVGDRCAVAVRFSADETIGKDGVPIYGERREMFEMLAELPDLWDINIADYSLEMGTSRFTKEAALEPYMHFVKSVTSKPVVTVGRFTSPDTMVSQLNRGIVDLIGAARPSIADPFLPQKIERGEFDTIRECIGCNICYSGDSLSVPIRCTQNPTMGEEWRKGWHPERVEKKTTDASVLIVGAGPAGLEAALTLGKRGYYVMVAEATLTLGGRVTKESALPGMSEYIRVRDHREQQLLQMPNIDILRDNKLSAEDVLSSEFDHVVIATGASWRRDRFDGKSYVPITKTSNENPSEKTYLEILTPDDIMSGNIPTGPTLVFDTDGYYMASVMAEKLVAEGNEVVFVTPSDTVSEWAHHTDERWRIRTHLMGLGVRIIPSHSLANFDGAEATLNCEYTDKPMTVAVKSVVMVTRRKPNDALYHALLAEKDDDIEQLPFSLTRIGDCEAPSIIAAAVYSGHRYARELDEVIDIDEPLKHDRVDVGNDINR
jgi:dimethylamine/trimethylamine dehydrogenase